MGLIDTSLTIGRSGILASQLAMDVTGNNIANASTDGYSRQVVDLRSVQGVNTATGANVGLGVSADQISRICDDYLEQRLRDATSSNSSASVVSDAMTQLEGAFNELSSSNSGLSNAMDNFFTAINTLQSQPEDTSVRSAVTETADTLTETITGLRQSMEDIRSQLDGEVTSSVNNVNSMTSEIASLNQQICAAQGGQENSGSSNSLLDRRDQLLGKLSDLVSVRTVNLGNGTVNVFTGSEPLVMGATSYALSTETCVDHGQAVSMVKCADGAQADLSGGQLGGFIEARDQDIPSFMDKLDSWTGALIYGVNEIHASGQGLSGYTSVSGTYGVSDPNAALNAAGLPFTAETGIMNLKVTSGGTTKTFQIHVDLDGLGGNDTSLSSLVADMNTQIGAVYPQVQASVGVGNTLKITSSDPNVTFAFGDDSSGALACLGVNTFFTGHNSTNIAVNPSIDSNPQYLAAATSDMAGDNTNAAKLAAFASQPMDELGGANVSTYYEGIVSQLGVQSAAASDRSTAAAAVQSALSSQRDAISGVSIDEEAVNLIRYQSAYTASARFITTISDMLKTLLAM